MIYYIVTGSAGANLRDLPSTSLGAVVAKLPVGTKVEVVSGIIAENSVGELTRYKCVHYNQRYLWCVSDLLSPCVYRLPMAASAALEVFLEIYRLSCKHGSGSKSLEDIRQSRITNCASSSSAVLQAAGCLEVGKIVSHTSSDGKNGSTKSTEERAITGYKNLTNCSIVRTNCVYSKLPSKYQKAGMVYVQDSNICVSAGGGRIYSCNATGEFYGKGGVNPLKSSGYPFTRPILYVIVPD